ncbi:MAG: uncharacterized protein A8A55_3458, partial [Amphiamblys sp. WSBS2006]
TTVTLENIAISSQLFCALLRKTRVCVGENFSIFANTADGDCIIENSILRDNPPSIYMSRFEEDGENETNTGLALENIKRIPQNSIGCDFRKIVFTDTVLTNILPKLKFHENHAMESLTVVATKNEHGAGILAQKQKIRIGRI